MGQEVTEENVRALAVKYGWKVQPVDDYALRLKRTVNWGGCKLHVILTISVSWDIQVHEIVIKSADGDIKIKLTYDYALYMYVYGDKLVYKPYIPRDAELGDPIYFEIFKMPEFEKLLASDELLIKKLEETIWDRITLWGSELLDQVFKLP